MRKLNIVCCIAAAGLLSATGCGGDSTGSESISPSDLSGTYQLELRHFNGSPSDGACDSPIVRISGGSVAWHYTTCNGSPTNEGFGDQAGGEIDGDTLVLAGWYVSIGTGDSSRVGKHRFTAFTRSGGTIESAWRGTATIPVGGGGAITEVGTATWTPK